MFLYNMHTFPHMLRFRSFRHHRSFNKGPVNRHWYFTLNLICSQYYIDKDQQQNATDAISPDSVLQSPEDATTPDQIQPVDVMELLNSLKEDDNNKEGNGEGLSPEPDLNSTPSITAQIGDNDQSDLETVSSNFENQEPSTPGVSSSTGKNLMKIALLSYYHHKHKTTQHFWLPEPSSEHESYAGLLDDYSAKMALSNYYYKYNTPEEYTANITQLIKMLEKVKNRTYEEDSVEMVRAWNIE